MNKKTILIAGGTGLIGQKLIKTLDPLKYNIHILSRTKKEDTKNIKYFIWDVEKGEIDLRAIHAEYIINLTGAGIADHRWTDTRKEVIIKSRVESAALILRSIKNQNLSPQLYLSASAIGFYGSRGSETLDESSTSGDGFLADCCQKWENTTLAFHDIVQRVAIVRIGVVLSIHGGALPKMLMTKNLGLFTYFGSGGQYYSWIHIEDLVRVFINIIHEESYAGVFNCVAPKAVTNKDFTLSLKKVFGGVLALSAPAFMLRLFMGEMADVILDSSRVVPKRLLEKGFEFKYDTLDEALKSLKE